MLVTLRLDGTAELLSGAWRDPVGDPVSEDLAAVWAGALPTSGVLHEWEHDGQLITAEWEAPAQLSVDWSEEGEPVTRPGVGTARFRVPNVARAQRMASELAPVLWEAVGVVETDWGYGAARFVFETATGIPTETSWPVPRVVFPKPEV